MVVWGEEGVEMGRWMRESDRFWCESYWNFSRSTVHNLGTGTISDCRAGRVSHANGSYTDLLAAGMRYHRQQKYSMGQYLTPSRSPSNAPVSILAKKRKATQLSKTASGD